MTTPRTNPDGVALMTDRHHLTTSAYGASANLSARQAIYAFQEPAIDFPAWALALAPIGEGATVLDVGCGNGVYLRRLAARPDPTARLLGLDLSRGMLTDLRREWEAAPPRPHLAVADLQALPLPDAGCDIALAMHMLFHLPNLARGVAELRRVLRPGGVLLAATNGADHLRELGDLIDAAMTNVAGRPVTLPRVSGLRFALENGAEALRAAFASVERHDARSALVIPTPEPVVRYTASLATAREALPAGTDWAAVLTEVERRTSARIAAHGAFRVTTQAGVFVCA